MTASHRRRPTRTALALVAALAAGAAVLAGCSSAGGSASPSTAAAPTTTTAGPGGSPDAGGAHPCDQGASLPDLQVAPVDGHPHDRDLTSFDGTVIRLHWFPVDGASADAPAPTVLMGPGWSLAGDTDTGGGALFSAMSIKDLWADGYNVLTWDPRGFGQSEGVATVDAADTEGRDVQALLDFVADQPEALLDDPGDPRAGMVGFSYGGGIQLTVGAIDCRVDALVPGIAWHSLDTSLYKAKTVKSGWADILTRTVPADRVDPHVISARDSGLATGTISDEDRQWFISRGPGDAVAKIDVPTLLVGGTVDTLFTLDEDVTNYGLLHDAGVPVAMVWFCGGHGTCLTDAGDPGRIATATSAWLARYLVGDTSVATGPVLDLVDQDGTRWTADAWPVPTAEPLVADGTGTLALQADGGSGGDVTLPDPSDPGAGADPLAAVVARITPTRAANAVDVPVDVGDRDALALGAPTLELRYQGTVPDGDRPTRVFAQLVDEDRGVVVGNQITPIAVTLDGQAHTTTVPLEIIAQHVTPGAKLTLQLVATATAYATPRLGGQVTFDRIHLEVPVAAADAVTDPRAQP